MFTCQLIQESKNHHRMTRMPTGQIADSTIAGLVTRAHEKLGPAVRFEVQVVDHIPLAPSGKMMQSINLVDSPNRGTTFDFADWHRQRAVTKEDPE